MQLPQYVTIEETKRVCAELSIRDWTTLGDGEVLAEEAQAILAEMKVEGMSIDVETFRQGLEVELEHGVRFKDANVTNNHPILTGKIVLAHLKETMDYYQRLDVAEIEGDVLKAVAAKDLNKVGPLYKKLCEAKTRLIQAESDRLE